MTYGPDELKCDHLSKVFFARSKTSSGDFSILTLTDVAMLFEVVEDNFKMLWNTPLCDCDGSCQLSQRP